MWKSVTFMKIVDYIQNKIMKILLSLVGGL